MPSGRAQGDSQPEVYMRFRRFTITSQVCIAQRLSVPPFSAFQRYWSPIGKSGFESPNAGRWNAGVLNLSQGKVLDTRAREMLYPIFIDSNSTSAMPVVLPNAAAILEHPFTGTSRPILEQPFAGATRRILRCLTAIATMSGAYPTACSGRGNSGGAIPHAAREVPAYRPSITIEVVYKPKS
ncbi:hypothetical protein FN846DRAFT_889647 [Sphaerosporella brunnea]|uniref:Uncharacterized protein n=1 Tax=Sphaerosporella brunnea TaxID=1250544 RepID=A0A5J5EZ58_9PEZI|nr:hypothetical protein FN846DRAFT_889647 [Sphaerosporella brunnea]